MPKKISLQDIADSLGLSRGTVDRAIHNRGRINSLTRDRIISEARRLGYIDRKVNSFLPLQHRVSIKVVIPGEDPFFMKIEEGIRKAAKEIIPHPDFEIVHIQLEKSEDQIDYLSKAVHKSSGIDGILLVPSDQTILDDAIAAVERAGIRLATLNTDAPGSRRSFFIGQDPYASGRTAGEIMLKMNSGSVIILSGYKKIRAHSERLRGFLDVYRESAKEQLLRGPFYTHDDVHESSSVLENHSPDFDGIFTVSGFTTEGAGKFLSRTNQTDLVLVGFDCTAANISLLKNRYITCLISQSPELQGYLAAGKLLKAVKGETETEQTDVKIPIDIYFRENIDFYRNHLES